MLTAIVNSTHLESVKTEAIGPLHLDSIESYPNGLSLPAISLALGTQATAHGKLLGIYSGFDPARDCGWVVLSTNLRILQYVPRDRPVKVETWIASLESGKLIREYRISENGVAIIEAAHAFVLFDRVKRRIVIPPLAAREKLRGKDPTFKFNLEISRRTWPPDFFAESRPIIQPVTQPVDQAVDQIDGYVVTNSDIDQNHHLNNSVYLRWVEPHLEKNGISARPTSQFKAFEFGIEFLSEASLDEKIQVRTVRKENTTYFLSANSSAALLAVSKATLLDFPRG